MALRFTLKKKDYGNDERTVPADDFLSLAARKAEIKIQRDVPRTEMPPE